MMGMEQINRILKNERYQSCLKAISECEKDRIFCHHDMVHFMDVARIAYIINLTESYEIEKERIYAAALLHDCGRHIQYQNGIPHELASAEIAPLILLECGFQENVIREIVEAIANHRNKSIRNDKNLNGLLYRADKMSRSCFGCKAEKLCDWSDEKKNLEIDI